MMAKGQATDAAERNLADGMYGGPESRERGLAIRLQIFGQAKLDAGHHTDSLAPEFGALADEIVYGDVWARPGLDLRTRLFLTIAIDIALQRDEYAAYHLSGARNVGISRDELIELAFQLAMYAGMPAGYTALRLVAEEYQE
jgi:4-carboxymuconolactone decarboxylase